MITDLEGHRMKRDELQRKAEEREEAKKAKRKQEKEEAKQREYQNGMVPRGELFHYLNNMGQNIHEAITKTSEVADTNTLLTATMNELLIEKGIYTKEEFEAKLRLIAEDVKAKAEAEKQAKADAENAARIAEMSAIAVKQQEQERITQEAAPFEVPPA